MSNELDSHRDDGVAFVRPRAGSVVDDGGLAAAGFRGETRDGVTRENGLAAGEE